MIILIGFLLPLIAYWCLLRWITRSRREHLERIALLGALGVAVWTMLAVMLTVSTATLWRGGANIGWGGIVSESSKLVIGGTQEGATIGWSERHFNPRLEVQSPDANTARLVIAGGEGFVYDRSGEAFLNGEELTQGADKAFGDFRLHHTRYWLKPFSRIIEVRDGNDRVLTFFTLPRKSGANDNATVFSLRRKIEFNAGTLRDEIQTLIRVEEAAVNIKLLVTATGKVLVLDEAARQARCALPCRLSVKWMGRKLPFTINRSQAQISVDFDAPLRTTSPLPPTDNKGEVELTITGSPVPGDVAFVLPVGGSADEWRGAVSIADRDEYKFKSGATPATTTLATTARVSGGSGISYKLEITNNLPRIGGVGLLLFVTFIPFALGLCLCGWRMPGGKARVALFGLGASVWSLAAFRLLLALRFATDTYALDDITVKGVTLSYLALLLIPGVMFLVARWRRDIGTIAPHESHLRQRGLVISVLYISVVAVCGSIIYSRTPSLWNALPERYAVSLGLGAMMAGALVLLYAFFISVFIYKIIEEDAPNVRWRVLFPLRFPEWFLEKGTRVWQRLAERKGNYKVVLGFIIVGIVVYVFSPFVFGRIGSFGGRKLLQENFIPLIFFWLPVLFWLGSKRVTTNAWLPVPSKIVISFAACLTILIPLFSVPIASADVGSIYSALAIFVSLAGVLLVRFTGRTGWARAGIAVWLSIFAAVLIAYFAYARVEQLPLLPGNARARLLTFKEGRGIERVLANADRDDAGGGNSSVQQLRNVYEHTQENKAIAHEGGWFGLGFGNAPTRRSSIRQDTLQFDSAYSFFVVSEHGIIGGASLLFMYLMPLLFVWQSRTTEFDAGHALALIICSVLLLEALTHAAMNTSLLPITGRSLPLINVNSPSDLLRWIVLMAIAAQSLVWRHDEAEVADVSDTSSQSDKRAKSRVMLAIRFLRRIVPRMTPMAVIPALLFAGVLASGIHIARDKMLEQPLDYQEFNHEIRRHIEAGDIALQPDLTLTASDNIAADSFLRDEINRFNATPRQRQIEQRDPTLYENELSGAGNRGEYNARLNRLRVITGSTDAPERINLFRLVPQHILRPRADGDEVASSDTASLNNGVPAYRIAINPMRPASVIFGLNPQASDAPVVRFSDDDKSPLVGAAWVNGRWIATYDRNAPLSWTDALANAFESARLTGTGTSTNEHRLTLKRNWQTAAMSFAETKGRALHEKLLAARASTNSPESLSSLLPSRVAITVLDARNGATLALGGYPRTAPGRFWRQDATSREWMPPAAWLSTRAPQSFRSVYAGERNFARMIVGSTTKPMFAAAALATHPNLDERLQVQGTDSTERDVFGLQLSSAWQVTPLGGWRDFDDYLAWSDNRYHVRLGFLGLSEMKENEIAVGGASSSIKESLTANAPRPWNQRPRFVSPIETNNERFTKFSELHNTPFAAQLGSMFSIGVKRTNDARRISFWSNGEKDEAGDAAETTLRPFTALLPERANLALDEITNPRDYVSVLFGGYTNLWSNVDLAAAFLTTVTGQPRTAHILAGNTPFTALETRRPFPDIAARLRPGLADCVTKGTATEKLKSTQAFALLGSLKGVKAYAKTGTLRFQANEPSTSRIILALIKWKDERQGTIDKGIVISIVGERAGSKTATEWLGEFLVINKQLVASALN